MTIVLTGFMGCGKTAAGKELAEMLGFPFVDLDAYIEHKAGRTVAEIFSEGEEVFRALEAEAVRDVVTMHQITGEDVVLSLGGGTFSIAPIRKLLLEQTTCVFLKAGLDVCLSRISDPDSRPMLRSGVKDLFDSRQPLYEQAPYTVSSENKDIRATATEIKTTLRI